jgi:hypothetical protein
MSALRSIGLAITLALVACGGGNTPPGDDTPGDDGNTPDAPGAQPGARVNMVFAISSGARQNPNLTDPLVGAVYGQLFHSSDVTITGPIDGAVEYGAIEVAAIDLITAETAGMWMSLDLAPADYTFLGFFDVDGNGATDRSPDAGDPVTFPTTNTFEIVAGVTTPVMLTATFDFVYF